MITTVSEDEAGLQLCRFFAARLFVLPDGCRMLMEPAKALGARNTKRALAVCSCGKGNELWDPPEWFDSFAPEFAPEFPGEFACARCGLSERVMNSRTVSCALV